MKIKLTYLKVVPIIVFTFFGCKQASINLKSKSIENYKEIRDDLCADEKGNIYFKTIDGSDPKNPVDRYIDVVYSDSFGVDGIKKMKEVLDSASFRTMGSSYYRDKNHIYYFFEMADGGTMRIIDEANFETFKVLKHSNYGIDMESAFYRGTKIQGADVLSFEPIIIENNGNKIGWYAKDKKNYYNGYDVMTEAEIQELKEEIKWLKEKER